MSKEPERDIEALLRGGEFSNPAYKKALREKLFSDMHTLDLDDLALVAGGVSVDSFRKEDWPDEEKEEKP